MYFFSRTEKLHTKEKVFFTDKICIISTWLGTLVIVLSQKNIAKCTTCINTAKQCLEINMMLQEQY